jgi:hypothetical protein
MPLRPPSPPERSGATWQFPLTSGSGQINPILLHPLEPSSAWRWVSPIPAPVILSARTARDPQVKTGAGRRVTDLQSRLQQPAHEGRLPPALLTDGRVRLFRCPNRAGPQPAFKPEDETRASRNGAWGVAGRHRRRRECRLRGVSAPSGGCPSALGERLVRP